MPLQHLSQPSGTETRGTVFDRRIVLEKFLARKKPEQNGQRHRVAPSPSGGEWRIIRQRALRLNLDS